jgi:hypothetical protein
MDTSGCSHSTITAASTMSQIPGMPNRMLDQNARFSSVRSVAYR